MTVTKNTKKYMALTIAATLALSACDKVGSFFSNDNTQDEEKELVQRIEPPKDDGSVGMLLPDFAQLVQNEGQTVVNIQATATNRSQQRAEENGMDLSQFPDNDPFYEFFKRLVPNLPDMPQEEADSSELNFGSGFIISSDGYILTNTHVVAGMGNIKVLLNDKREYTAKLIGSDQQSDVALLKIDAKDLPVVKIGDPKTLKPGEWVAAIGAPFGFDNSVTSGIVSAKGRSLPNENYTPFIQTDVAINPGNSGGPLFNLKGQVVGINSQIYSRSGGFMGISFAIPIDVAMNVADQLKTSGKVQRGQLGVIIQEVSYDLAKSFNLDRASGALIAKVMPNSPAQQAGLQVGDIVRSVNGEEVRSSSDLPVMVGAMPPGKEVKLEVWRKGKKISVNVTLGSTGAPTPSGESEMGSLTSPNDVQSFLVEEAGLTLQTQTTDGKRRLIVTHVSGAAERAGLKRGDEIMAVSQITVNDESSFRSALSSTGKNVPLLVQRGSDTLFLALNLQ
ncbi:DegQ family serine endoprotease [Neisseria weixii]|uniref:Probable periplasmic serine endoprotease DegP-like n=1 Tax=Neisseria weixii TaxID=1853276 RepID=A0A3N4MKF5_9NEIS|nr:DegQ family serine endoprotease [Neisseria weixii]RPD84194.1 DegQ family serine endoprotease [Neisseria weixii]RPD84787.1 DegQ family serine endoprotease [Neisseria weixii]